MRILLFLTALFYFVGAQAQNTVKDSLKNKLVVTKEDTERVYVLEALSYAYLSSHPDTALKYALEGLQLAQKIKYPKGEATCTNALGNVYFHTGDNARALQMYLRYLELKEGLKDGKNIGVAYFNIASAYTEEKDYRHALTYLFRAKREDEKAKDSAGILFDLYSLGSIYLRMHDADSALYNFNQSYQLALSMDDKNMLGAILNNFGETYLFKNNTALAEKYYRQSIPFVEVVNDNEVLTSNYYGLAKIFAQRSVQDSAIYYGRKALLIATGAPFLKQVVEISAFLTDLFSTQKQFDSAFYYQQINVTTKDSLFNVEQVRKVQNLKFEEQERQQAIETAQIRYRNRVTLFIVVFASVIFLITALILWRNNKDKQRVNASLSEAKEKAELTVSKLKLAQAQLIQAEKMASLGELTAGIAHEIQNPLNFINNFSDVNAELLEEMKVELDSGNKDAALAIAADVKANERKIHHHGKRADAIVKSMLQHSRSSSGQKEPSDINELADEYLRLSYHGLRAKDKSFNVVLNARYDDTLTPIAIMPQEIGRVLLNLYNNAFYAVRERQKAKTVTGENYEPTVWVTTKRISTFSGVGRLEISVRDNGIGIPQKVVDKIFQPFFTTKPSGQGTGLGLSLSYDIIKAHGGEIKVDTKEGEGSEFIIQLPVQNSL